MIYASSHAHYCGNLPDGFNQTDPWTQHYGTAFTKAALGTLKADPLGYFNWVGNPSPVPAQVAPAVDQRHLHRPGPGRAGTSPATTTTSSIGGEFPTAGGVAQQGLVRYAVREIAPNKVGPVFTQSKMNPALTSFVAGHGAGSPGRRTGTVTTRTSPTS